MANPRQAKITAKALAVMISKASLRRNGKSLKPMLLLSLAFFHQVLRQEQQPRPDFKFCRFGRIQIDLEADFVFFQQKADHPTRVEKAGSLSYGQNRSIVQ